VVGVLGVAQVAMAVVLELEERAYFPI